MFHPDQGRPGPATKAWKRPVFLNVGRVAVEKNVKAFLALDLPGSKVVVGDGPSRDRPSRPSIRRRSSRGARFREDLAAFFAAADVFVFPSLTDTFGLVILEAMAAGAPVAGFPRAAGPVDIIPGSGAGVVDETLTEGLAQGLPRLPQKARSQGGRAPMLSGSPGAGRRRSSSPTCSPIPEPEKARFWRRLRRLARLRRSPAQV